MAVVEVRREGSRGEGVSFFLRAGFLSSFCSDDQAVAMVEVRREGSKAFV